MKKLTALPILILLLGFSLPVQAQSNTGENNTKDDMRVQPRQMQLANSPRKMVKTPDWNSLQVEATCTVHFLLEVDNMGHVINVRINEAKTTTRDQNLLDKLVEKVKSEVLYESKAGTTMQTMSYAHTFFAK